METKVYVVQKVHGDGTYTDLFQSADWGEAVKRRDAAAAWDVVRIVQRIETVIE